MSLSGLLFVGWPTGDRGRGLGSPIWATDLSLKSGLHETLSQETEVLQLGGQVGEGLRVAGGPGFEATRDLVRWHKCCSKVQRTQEELRPALAALRVQDKVGGAAEKLVVSSLAAPTEDPSLVPSTTMGPKRPVAPVLRTQRPILVSEVTARTGYNPGDLMAPSSLRGYYTHVHRHLQATHT